MASHRVITQRPPLGRVVAVIEAYYKRQYRLNLLQYTAMAGAILCLSAGLYWAALAGAALALAAWETGRLYQQATLAYLQLLALPQAEIVDSPAQPAEDPDPLAGMTEITPAHWVALGSILSRPEICRLADLAQDHGQLSADALHRAGVLRHRTDPRRDRLIGLLYSLGWGSPAPRNSHQINRVGQQALAPLATPPHQDPSPAGSVPTPGTDRQTDDI